MRATTRRAAMAGVWLCAALSLLSTSPAAAGPVCGPGLHWVDTCPGGTDTFPSAATVGIDLTLDGITDMTIIMSGPTTIYHWPGVPHAFNTEMVQMDLIGMGFRLVAGVMYGLSPSLGQVKEQPGDPTLADSFFDVFFEVQLPGGGSARNDDPLRVQAVIDRTPPLGIPYTHGVGQPIPLYDENRILVAYLVDATHTPYPEPATWGLLATGLGALLILKRRSAA